VVVAARHTDVGTPRDSARRAAVELLAMLVVAGALLAAPFVWLSVVIDQHREPPPETAAWIKQSSCTQLRAGLANRPFTDSVIDFWGAEDAIVRRIVERSEKLGCRPVLRMPPRYSRSAVD
jgi:hypothetical protein